MPGITITEGLAEIKTIGKRIAKKEQTVWGCLYRHDVIRDPHAKSGGSAAVVERELQGIKDLEDRIVSIRRAIREANAATEISVCGTTKSIEEWLTWRREVAPGMQHRLANMRARINAVRDKGQKEGFAVLQGGQAASKELDVIVNLDEGDLAKQIEGLEETLGTLDGQLSLKNATVALEL